MEYSNNQTEILEKLKSGVNEVIKKDGFLFKIGVNERSISHKLACYLEKYFPDWDIDVEYNRDETEIEKLEGIRECNNRVTDLIYPDIIVHKWGKHENLLVMGIKMNSNDKCDDMKLKKLTDLSGDFAYKFGFFLNFNNTQKRYTLRVYENVEAIKDYC